MASFSINAPLVGYEYRGTRSGKLDDGTTWFQIVLEKPDEQDCSQVSVSVPEDLREDVAHLYLRKGDHINCVVEVSSRTYNGREYARMRLVSIPELVIDEVL